MKRDVAIRWKTQPGGMGSGMFQTAGFQIEADDYPNELVLELTATLAEGKQVVFVTVDGGTYIVDGSELAGCRISEPRTPVKFADA